MKYFTKALYALILVNSLLVISSSKSFAAVIVPQFIQKIDTSFFSPPSPDPAGIIYLPSKDAFLITDSEVNEIVILYEGGNAFEVDRIGGTLNLIFSTDKFSDEPTGITINPDNNHCFLTDDLGPQQVFEVDPGSDGLCLTSDDRVTSFNIERNIGSVDAEGIAYGQGSLFIADGKGQRVYRIRNKNGAFNKVRIGDNELSSFDTGSLGLHDPEGIVFDSTNNSLYIVSAENNLVQTTLYGVLLNIIDLSTAYKNASVSYPNKPAGVALAPTSYYSSTDKSATISLYLVARGLDNDDNPLENDGMIHELRLPTITTHGNNPPIVAAGENQSFELPNKARLDGHISDDGLPNNRIISTWSKYNGPGEVKFTKANKLITTASFSKTGTYVLRLTGYDGDQYGFDDLEVIVLPNMDPPVISLLGDNPLLLNINDTFTDPWATAFDEVDGDISDDIETVSNVNTAVAGSYQATYTITDSDGNDADSITLTVIIRDNTIAPVISLTGDDSLLLNINDTFTDPGATATDEIDGDISDHIEAVSNVNTAVANSYLVTYTVTDSDGISASITRIVIIRDNTLAPVITLIGTNPLRLNINAAFTDPGATAVDEVDGDISDDIEAVYTVNTAIADSYLITYTVTDSDGNISSATRNVIITDNTGTTTDPGRTTAGGGGSSEKVSLLLLALAFLLRHQKKGGFEMNKVVKLNNL